jgi:RNA polymerase sigma-70 factor (ECF subfamily)
MPIGSSPSSLLQRIAGGDAGAVSECIERYGGVVWSLARRFSRGQPEAEDAAQEIFVDIWKSASRFDPLAGSEIAFVAMIARRRLIDRKRRRSRALETEPLHDAELPFAVAHPPRAEVCAEATLAARAIAELRPEQQKVLVMAICQGLSHEEIASATGMPLGTVKAYARRGLIKVRAMLSEVETRTAPQELKP